MEVMGMLVTDISGDTLVMFKEEKSLGRKAPLVQHRDGQVTITVECIYCRCLSSILTTTHNWNLWQEGNIYIEDAFPDLDFSERELLLSSHCPSCFNYRFPDIKV